MQLNQINDNVLNTIQEIIFNYYKYQNRFVSIYEGDIVKDSWGEEMIRFRFLVDRKHVLETGIGKEAMPHGYSYKTWMALAIGPKFFTAADFWDYENYERFDIDATDEAIIHNLKLMDEFFNICY